MRTEYELGLGIRMSRRELLASAILTGTAYAGSYLVSKFFGVRGGHRVVVEDSIMIVSAETKLKQAKAIQDYIEANKQERTEVTVVPVLPRGIGYVRVRGLATRDFPNDEDSKNLLPYQYHLFPHPDGEPSIIYTHLASIIYPNGDVKVWTVRPDTRYPNVSGGWLFSTKVFTINGETEEFISDTPTNELEMNAASQIIP